jgi:uncharacterized membrane protein YhaH (DUF805 family)
MFEQAGPRMGQSEYWLAFLACWGVTFAGVFGLVFASFINSDFFKLLSVLALLGGSIYIRIAQMQRCNDVGWPWQIPWFVFGVSLAITVVAQFAAILALLMLPLTIIVGLGDLVFGIVLGCIPSKQIAQPDYDPQAYRDSYADYGAPNLSASQAAEAQARKQQASVRLGIETAAVSASGKRIASVTQAEPAPPPPRAMGFGRKGAAG